MKTSTPSKEARTLRPARALPYLQKTNISARERLLKALESTPTLTSREARHINDTVQEAREASLADTLPA